eukprot:TRINITY_DN63_c0_g1_i1.p1 TRINITY_DN63_c0_g1~~TRINITY_DN63_c0_g1_i1.p1  ORF type:complete len:386 (-),score=214.52 TRINITY_DN63_c0_g1_i1:331-1488(-)
MANLFYEEENANKNPSFELARQTFAYSIGNHDQKDTILKEIEANDMAPYYLSLCEKFGWEKNEELYTKMNEANQKKFTEFADKLKDAEENLGENEVREALLAHAEYLCQIGAKDEAISAFRKTADKTVALGQRLDVVFYMIRIGFFFGDHDLISRNIEKAESLIEEGGDWDRKNRLKVIEAIFSMKVRNFNKSAGLFLETLSTFTSYELFDYKTFIFYTVVMGCVSLDRTKIKTKVINSPEVVSVARDDPVLNTFLNSFYNSNYKEFFASLVEIQDRMTQDWVLRPHAQFFCREMRIRAYSQLLESYKSVQLNSMASDFGVNVEYIDRELSRFIAAGRLHCKIDKVAGIVETTRPDTKNAQYQAAIKQGDILLNRIQKLSRVINL